jgi:microcystin-dependent protein
VVIGAGNGPGLSPRIQGTPVGEATVTLPFSEMAAHQHSFNLMYNSSSTTFLDAPVANGYFAGTSDGSVAAGPASTTLNANAVGVAGGSGNPATTQAHANVQPVLSIPYCIALLGLWPDFVD